MSENNGGTGAEDFDAFVAAGNVEVGESNLASQKGEGDEGGEEGDKPAKPAPKKPAPKPAPKTAAKPNAEDQGGGEEGGEDGGEGDEGEEGGEESEKPKRKPPSERIRELNKRLRQEERLRLASDDRLSRLEKLLEEKGLSPAKGDGNSSDDFGPAPDPSDTAKYPLGHLDDRYIEDKLEWLATKKAAGQADAVLQRQQENERQAEATRQHDALMVQVDELAARGAEIDEDFQEKVVDTGLKGDWALSQPTFEACYEADHGAEILLNLSQDEDEALRVSKLTPYQQLKYVQEKDAEIAEKRKPRKIPGAGEPPRTQTKGSSSKTQIKPDTDNLDDFEKAWEADAKAHGR